MIQDRLDQREPALQDIARTRSGLALKRRPGTAELAKHDPDVLVLGRQLDRLLDGWSLAV
jgi:hypothetical protein